MTSNADESRALALSLDALEGVGIYPDTEMITRAQKQVNALWQHTLESLKDKSLVCAGRRRSLEARVVACLASDVDMARSPRSIGVEVVDPRDDLPEPASPKLIRCQPLRPGAHEGEEIGTLSGQGSCAFFPLTKECATVTPDDVGDICPVENGCSGAATAVPSAKRRLGGNFETERSFVALKQQRSGVEIKRAK